MKLKIAELRKMVREVIHEAAAEGKMQKYYRNTYARMIATASTGGNKNTPPFTEKAAGPSKSGPDDSDNSGQ
tara:strand:- start:250 stop:465 length:216 start_codon:yes stop_codon:yes gene_type:complete